MSDLATLQSRMRAALVEGGEPEAGLAAAIDAGTLTSVQRIRVHQNNYRQTLTTSLLAIFPVAAVFVGEQFLRGVAGKYVQAHPPVAPMLSAYGATFADFLDDFPPVAQVSYLPDIVRLEWAVHELQVAREAEEEADGVLCLSPNARLVDSRYPILNLWMAGTGQIPPEAVNVKSGGQCAAAVLRAGEVRLMALEGKEHAIALAPASAGGGDEAIVTRLRDMGVLAGRA